MKKALRILPVCVVLIVLLLLPSSALGEDLVPATDTPAGAYTYFPNGIPQNLVFYFPKALTEGFWQNLPESIYYDYPDHNLPADALEYYRQNLEPLLSSHGGHIPGLPKQAYSFYPNGLPDDFLAYFPSAMKEEFWTYFPNSIVMDYGDELPPNAWNYFLNVAPASLNLGIMPLTEGAPVAEDPLSPVLAKLKPGFWDDYQTVDEKNYAEWFEENSYDSLDDVLKEKFKDFHAQVRHYPAEEHYVKAGGTIYFAGEASGTGAYASQIEAQDVVTNDYLARAGKDRYYDGEFIPLDDCTYTFELVANSTKNDEVNNHTEAQYYIKSTKGEVYLSPPDVGVNYAFNTNTKTATRVERIMSNNDTYRFAFSKAVTGQAWAYRYIFFEKVNSANHAYKFDVWPRTPNVTSREVSLLFDLYEQITDAGGSKSYVPATEIKPTTETETHKYVIAATIREANANDREEEFTYRFLLRPSVDFTNKNVYYQSVKWTDGVASQNVDGYKVTVNSGIDFGASTVRKDAGVLVIGDKVHRVHAVKLPTTDELQANTQVNSVTGVASGCEISKISMSLGSIYQVAPAAGKDAVYWISQDEKVATVDNRGTISAVGVTDGSFGKTWVAYMDRENKLHAIEVVVINQKLSANKKLMDIYLNRVDYHSDLRASSVSNVWIDKNYPLKKTYPREVYYYEFDVNEEAGLVFFDKPFFGDLNSDKNKPDAPSQSSEEAEKTQWFTVAADDILIDGAAANEDLRNNPEALKVFRPTAQGGDDNVQYLLNTARAQGFADYVSIVSPSYSTLKAKALDNGDNGEITVPDIRMKLDMGSSPRIRVTSADAHTYDKNSVYRLVIEEVVAADIWTAGELPEYYKLAEAYISKDGEKLSNVTVQDAQTVTFTIPTELLSVEGLDGNHLRYQVQTIHSEQVQDLGIFSKDSENKISLSLTQFSPFLITPTDEYYKVTIAWETTDAQVECRNNYQWNPKELCYECISTQLFTTTPGTAEIKVTNESTRDVAYAISHAGRAVSKGGYTMVVAEDKETEEKSNASATLGPGNTTEKSQTYKAKFFVKDGSGMPEEDYGKSEVAIGTFTVTVSKAALTP